MLEPCMATLSNWLLGVTLDREVFLVLAKAAETRERDFTSKSLVEKHAAHFEELIESQIKSTQIDARTLHGHTF